MNTGKFVDSIKEKLLPETQQTEVVKPETVPADSNQAQQAETQVKVPDQTQVARPPVPDINEVINRPLSAERAEVLFPQDELLQASLKRRA
jgi:hypothetical protein